jgi:hypothetical protein
MLDYFSAQGKVYTALKGADGLPLDFIFRGNVPSFQIGISVDTIEHKESTSGRRLIDLRLITGQKVDITMNMQQISPENQALLTQGDILTQASGSVTAFQLNGGAALVAGKNYALQDKDVSSLVLTDSAGTPATLATPANYLPNLPYGLVQYVGGSFTAPIKAAYTKKTGQKSVGILTEAPAMLWIRFLGINTSAKTTAGAYKRFVMDLFNVQFDPAATMDLIQDAIADRELKGSALVDPTRADDADGGQIGLLTWIDD